MLLGWTKVRVKDAVTQIVCRTSNRVFVGLPLCAPPLETSSQIDCLLTMRYVSLQAGTRTGAT